MATIIITADTKEYRLRPGDITALDAKDFLAHVGVSLDGVLGGQALDRASVAGLIWLSRRRIERGLPFEAVAKDITYETDLTVNPETAEAPTEDASRPET